MEKRCLAPFLHSGGSGVPQARAEGERDDVSLRAVGIAQDGQAIARHRQGQPTQLAVAVPQINVIHSERPQGRHVDHLVPGVEITRRMLGGFSLNGNGTVLDGCKATSCAAEGVDNGDASTNTRVLDCTLKKSRIDYAGASNIQDDTGTKFTTGGQGTAPEID